MVPGLPIEIIRCIASHLDYHLSFVGDCPARFPNDYHQKRDTLLSLSLVNRAWRHEAQRLLFRSIYVRHSKTDETTYASDWESEEDMDDDLSDLESEDTDDEAVHDTAGSSPEPPGGHGILPGPIHTSVGEKVENGNTEPHTIDDSHQEASSESDSLYEWIAPNETRNQSLWDQGLPAALRGMSKTAFLVPDNASGVFMAALKACTPEETSRLEMLGLSSLLQLVEALCSSPRLASYLRELQYPYQYDIPTLPILLAVCPDLERLHIHFVRGHDPHPPENLRRSLSNLEKLSDLTLQHLAFPYLVELLHGLKRPIRSLRLVDSRWSNTSLSEETRGQLGRLEVTVTRHLELAAVATSAAVFQQFLARMRLIPGQTEVVLDGLSWIENGDQYDPFGQIDQSALDCIVAYTLFNSWMEPSDFRNIHRLKNLRSLGFRNNQAGLPEDLALLDFPDTVTVLHMTLVDLMTWQNDTTLPVLLSWLRNKSFPGLRQIVFETQIFEIRRMRDDYDFEATHEEIKADVLETHEFFDELESALSAAGIVTNIKPKEGYERFLQTLKPLWDASQPWPGTLADRSVALWNMHMDSEPLY